MPACQAGTIEAQKAGIAECLQGCYVGEVSFAVVMCVVMHELGRGLARSSVCDAGASECTITLCNVTAQQLMCMPLHMFRR